MSLVFLKIVVIKKCTVNKHSKVYRDFTYAASRERNIRTSILKHYHGYIKFHTVWYILPVTFVFYCLYFSL